MSERLIEKKIRGNYGRSKAWRSPALAALASRWREQLAAIRALPEVEQPRSVRRRWRMDRVTLIAALSSWQVVVVVMLAVIVALLLAGRWPR